jgi:N-methylhydantoinase B
MITAAHSPNVRERRDCSTAIFDPTGQIIAQAPFVPMHLGSRVGLIGEVLKRFPRDTLRPGDVFLANDPYAGGGAHLPDITAVSPVFHRDELVAFVADIAHHADVGGMVPGSESAACTSIYQEGIRLPPVRVYPELGEGDGVTQIIMSNSRTPEERLGDLQAQMAALHVGVRGVQQVCQRYGAATMQACADHFLDYSERRMRQLIARLKEGTYTYADYLDSDGLHGAPVRIQCAATLEDGAVRLDFTGTDPQMASGKNVPMVATLSVVYFVLKMLLDPDLPPNSGSYRPVRVQAPEGCLVNPVPPAAVGARATSCGILGDVLVGALVQAMPEKALAPSGPHSLTTLAGTRPPRGQPFVDYETFAGALGARRHRDGTDAVRIHASGSANLPVESLELAYPLQVVRYELLRDGGGPGTFRGGMPVRRDTRILVPATTLSTTADRETHPAEGMEGGLSGAPSGFILNPGTPAERRVAAVTAGLPLEPGDVVSVRTAGGGGYGDPLERDPSRVLADLLDDRISPEAAKKIYGVAVRDGKVDQEATGRLRRKLRRARSPAATKGRPRSR